MMNQTCSGPQCTDFTGNPVLLVLLLMLLVLLVVVVVVVLDVVAVAVNGFH